MQPNYDADELNAVNEAKNLVHTKPKEAPELLNAVIARHQSEGKIGCALEARRWQCFALMSNLEYEKANVHIDLLVDEANLAGQRRYFGIAEMYRGIISVDCGQSDSAVEYFDHAIQLATELEDLDLMYRVQTNLAYALTMQERYEDALLTLKNCGKRFGQNAVDSQPLNASSLRQCNWRLVK